MTDSREVAKPTDRWRLVAQVLEHSGELSDRIVGRARAEMPGYTALSVADISRMTVAMVDRLMVALRDERPLTAEDLAGLREFGEVRARQGVSLSDVQNGWRIALREMLADLTDSAHRARIADRTLLALIHDLLDIVDRATQAFSGGHRDVEIELARHDQQSRAEFARGLLVGNLGTGDIRVQAQRYGLDPEGEYRALRVRGDDSAATADLRELITPGATAARVFATAMDGDICGFLCGTGTIETGGTIGLGPAVRLAELPRSFRLASRMLATAHRYAITGPADLDRLGLLPAIVADTDLGEELARRYLDPLGSGEQARIVIDTIDRYLHSGMRIEATAERLIVHQNTVRYRLARFEELTGTDLRAPYSAMRVWWAIQHRKANPVDRTRD
ncbi:helix-turn-helix domain-containing protein [Nocardia sp. NBC_01503]|uniref:PucR family transcriptional regulator n=1 Tax=Nocardia sp. NBC_01503 TaxID=2975997 RepID=UPI002E7B8005|nr:helix-turn-helix domain-containing protein [Nocardia sp. NBC_01503]WTL35510.1 helix-turn-helix domain-containing protein [Nocardia sp. NBC_01503]